MTNENVDVRTMFSHVETHLGAIYPTLMVYYAMCDMREVDGITLRLNTKTGMRPVLEYSSKFVSKLSIQVLGSLVSIELIRLLLHHPTTRLMYPHDRCLIASNIVCSDEQILRFHTKKELLDIYPTVKQLKEIEPKFNEKTDLYIEKVFGILGANKDSKKKITGLGSDDSNNDEQSTDGKSSKNNDSKGSNKDKKSKDQISQEIKDGKFDDEKDALSKHFSNENCKKNTEGWGENNIIDNRVAEEINRQSIEDWGKLPAHLKEQILQANMYRADPMCIIENFITSVTSDWKKSSRMRLPRRYENLVDEFPGHFYGNINGMQAKVLFAVDASGSMPKEEIEKGLGIFLSAFNMAESYYCTWDAACSDIISYKDVNTTELNCEGGGGTDPRCVLEKIEKEELHFDGVVFITDCWFDFPKPDYEGDIFILQSEGAKSVPDWCDFHMKVSELRED